MYFYLLSLNKEDILHRQEPGYKHRNSAYKSLDFLFKSYEPKFWYWEVIETFRRLFFTFLLEFGALGPNFQVRRSIFIFCTMFCVFALCVTTCVNGKCRQFGLKPNKINRFVTSLTG